MERILTQLKSFFSSLDKPVYLVGGAVRDLVLGIEAKDFDLEVFGMMPKDFESWLESQGVSFEIEPNSKFPVIRFKVANEEIEVGFPRRDNKTGKGHASFEISIDPGMTVEEAARRRDFTVNAMYYNIATGEIEDPFGGKTDLQNRVLRPVSTETFREDPLRIFRAMQFIGRMNLTSYNEVLSSISDEMAAELDSLPATSIWKEFYKLMTKSDNAGLGLALKYLLKLSETFGIFPIFIIMKGTRQSPIHHSEGDVFSHTWLVCQKYVESHREGNPNWIAGFLGCLIHDMGKPYTTRVKEDGKITAYGHEARQDEAINFLERIGTPKKIMNQALCLGQLHMLGPSMKDKTCFHTAEKLHKVGLSFKDWFCIKFSDALGSINPDPVAQEAKIESVNEFIDRIKDLGVLEGRLPELVKGRDILAINAKTPGKKIGSLLKEVRQLQFAGQLKSSEDAKAFLAKRLK